MRVGPKLLIPNKEQILLGTGVAPLELVLATEAWLAAHFPKALPTCWEEAKCHQRTSQSWGPQGVSGRQDHD